jgi:gas vesicle protein
MMAHKVSRTMADALMLVGGGVVGAGLGLLFAPHSGAKSRKKMMRFGRYMGDKSEKMMRDLTDFADTMGGKANKVLHRW